MSPKIHRAQARTEDAVVSGSRGREMTQIEGSDADVYWEHSKTMLWLCLTDLDRSRKRVCAVSCVLCLVPCPNRV